MTSGTYVTNRASLPDTPLAKLALDSLEAGIGAAHPRTVTREHVSVDGDTLRIDQVDYDLDAYDEVTVLGGGKAAATVAIELEAVLGDRLDGGVVVTNDPRETDRIDVREGSHPVPDAAGREGATAVLDRARAADERTLIVGVVTGGASALLPAPADGVSLDDLRRTTEALLEAGATIGEVNAVRKHCSALKGGQLGVAAAPATVACLALSDVVGDDVGVIGSGPFVPDESTFDDALATLDRYELPVPEAIRDRLEAGAEGEIPETPKPGDPSLRSIRTFLVGSCLTACEAARDLASDAGYEAVLLSSRVRGEASEAARTMVAVAEEVRASGNPVDRPAVVVAGGETTVTVRGDGEGGPNQEFAVAAGGELDDPGIAIAAVDTDGIDGPTDLAGGLVDAGTVDAREAASALADNDVTPLLRDRDAAIETGPTGTNVNDLRVAVIGPVLDANDG